MVVCFDSHSTYKHSLLSNLSFATLGRDHGRRGPFSEPLSCFQELRDPSGTVLGADVKRIRLSKMPPRSGSTLWFAPISVSAAISRLWIDFRLFLVAGRL
jgi:hypothetical protein